MIFGDDKFRVGWGGGSEVGHSLGGSGTNVGNATAGQTHNDRGPFFISCQKRDLVHGKHDKRGCGGLGAGPGVGSLAGNMISTTMGSSAAHAKTCLCCRFLNDFWQKHCMH